MKVSEEKQQVQLTAFTTQPLSVASRHQLSAERERRAAKTRGSRYSLSATMGGALSAVDRGKVIEVHYYIKQLAAFLSLDHCCREQPVWLLELLNFKRLNALLPVYRLENY